MRVKVTPPTARKTKETSEHIQITTAGSSRKPSYTRRISLNPKPGDLADRDIAETSDNRSVSSYTSAADDSSLGGRFMPVEIEVMHHDRGSDLSGASPSKQRYGELGSEVSSMPPDSMLNETQGSVTPVRDRSRSFGKDVIIGTKNTLKTPSRRRSRSLSKERVAQQVVEKLEGKPKDGRSGRRSHSKHRSRSVSSEQLVGATKSPKRKSSRPHQDEELSSNAESSLLTNSQLSPRRTSGDQYSFRSGTSKSSINNPKLIETVEEAIRRLILPELTTLKQEQRIQQNRHEFERNNSVTSNTTTSQGLVRRVSKHASAPDVSVKPKVVLNRDEKNSGVVLSGDSTKENSYDRDFESPSGGRFQREMSEETVIHTEEKEPRKNARDGHRLRDAAAVGIATSVLTSDALKHHDSSTSVGRRERRRRRSKSHSRSASLAESNEDIFNKHDVPPMPMRSDIYGSEVTRDSILSERTEDPASPSERRRAEIRQVSRGSGREVTSPASRTPTRTPINLRKGLGTHHSNLSRGDLSIHSAHSGGSLRDENRHSMVAEVKYIGATTGAPAADYLSEQHDDLNEHDEHAYAHRARNRGLSPIQSVASFKEENEVPNRNSLRQTHSSGSISSMDQRHGKTSGMSINSLSSAASTKIARSSRPRGINLENEQDVLDQHDLLQEDHASKDTALDDWYEEQHQKNNRYRQSFGSSNFRDSTEIQGMHDGLEAPYHATVSGPQKMQSIGANPEYIHTPFGVESAVASLMEPSVLAERPKVDSISRGGSLEDHSGELNEDHDETSKDIDIHHHETTHSIGNLDDRKQNLELNSPRQSVARSPDDPDEHVHMGVSGVPVLDDPIPEIGHGLGGSESDLVTNPSDIRDHWPYQPTPPQSKHDFVSHPNETNTHDSLKAAAVGMLSAAALAQQEKEYRESGQRSRELSMDDVRSAINEQNPVNHGLGNIHDTYMRNQPIPTPPMTKDEGYISAPAGLSPEPKLRSTAPYASKGMTKIDDLMADEDPFVSNPRSRHLSGNSHGMPSPLYDSATGGGIDRIQSKDIVALMDHVSLQASKEEDVY